MKKKILKKKILILKKIENYFRKMKKNEEKGYRNRDEYSIFFFLLMHCKKHRP